MGRGVVGVVAAATSGHLDHRTAFPFHQRQRRCGCRHRRRQSGGGGGKIRQSHHRVLIGHLGGGGGGGGRRRCRRRHSAVRTRRGDAQLLHLVVKGARWDLELARGLQGRHAAFDGLNGGRDVTVGVLLVALPLQLLRGDVGGDASATCISFFR